MLSALSRLYGKIIESRNSLYEKNLLKTHSLGAPCVSVGNITVGGTGKTPLVAFIAEVLSEAGESVCVISRGYKRADENKKILVSDGEKIFGGVREAGDEPLELAEALLGKASVIADADRVRAGLWASEKLGATVFVLDDAFQHRRAKRDLDIVAIDATNPFGNRKTLPGGILREPLSALRRADAFVITRANLSGEILQIKEEIARFNDRAPIFTASNKFSDFVDLKTSSKNFAARTDSSPKYFAFCALGNPENFFRQLELENFDLAGTQTFPDHYFFLQRDIRELERAAARAGASELLTTAKDAVKLNAFDFEIPCRIARSALIFDDEKKLREMIHAVLKKK